MAQKGQITKHEWEGNYFRKVCLHCEWERLREINEPIKYVSKNGNVTFNQPRCITRKIQTDGTKNN